MANFDPTKYGGVPLQRRETTQPTTSQLGANALQIYDPLKLTRMKEAFLKQQPIRPEIPRLPLLEAIQEAPVPPIGAGIGGVLARVAQVPQSLMTVGGQIAGGVLAEARGFIGKDRELREAGRETQMAGLRDIGETFARVPKGFTEELFAETGMPMPSEPLGLTGIAGFMVDVVGDPLNLMAIMIKGTTQADEVIKTTKKGKGILRRFGERLYQNVLRPSTADEAQEYKKLETVFRGILTEDVDTLGSRFSRYGIKGSLENMIGEINKRLPPLTEQLDEAIQVADDAGRKVNISKMIDSLDSLADDLVKIGDDTSAQTIIEVTDAFRKSGKEISVGNAVELRRLYDRARITARGALSESRSIKNRLYKTIGDSLRDEINKIPDVGKINAEVSTYLDGLEALAREAARTSRFGGLPLRLSSFFPWIRPDWSFFGSGAKFKTTLGKMTIDVSKALNVSTTEAKELVKILLPSFLRHLTTD